MIWQFIKKKEKTWKHLIVILFQFNIVIISLVQLEVDIFVVKNWIKKNKVSMLISLSWNFMRQVINRLILIKRHFLHLPPSYISLFQNSYSQILPFWNKKASNHLGAFFVIRVVSWDGLAIDWSSIEIGSIPIQPISVDMQVVKAGGL